MIPYPLDAGLRARFWSSTLSGWTTMLRYYTNFRLDQSPCWTYTEVHDGITVNTARQTYYIRLAFRDYGADEGDGEYV